jgi:Ig domain of plant-specific actin-binding protein
VINTLLAGGLPRSALGISEATSMRRRHDREGRLPVNTTPPTVSGASQVGQMLVVTSGAWSNEPTTFAYAWQRCDATGENCAYIAGASTSTYAVTPQDAGSTLGVAVTATNPVGRATTVSAPTAAVT